MNRDTAWQIVTEHVADEGLRRHMLAVEAAMRHYAPRLNADADRWGLAGLLHDFDWELHPTLDEHAVKGAPILRERGIDDDIVQAILAHNEPGTGVAPARDIDFALLACDEVTGLLIAATLVRPDKDIAQLGLKSVKKKWKDRRFAAGVDRDEAERAAARFSDACFEGKLGFWDHVGHVLEAMQERRDVLGLG
ncbi:MAG: HD domain-containing protein [Phycisphaeraceae bacterium]